MSYIIKKPYPALYRKGRGFLPGEDFYRTYGYRYNKITDKIINAINELRSKESEFNNYFESEVDLIFLTSQYRPPGKRPGSKTSQHSKIHGASDICFYTQGKIKEGRSLGYYINVYFMYWFRRYFPEYTIFISSFNHHLHIDHRKERKTGIELFMYGGKQLVLPGMKIFKNIKRYISSNNYKISIGGLEAHKDVIFKYYGVDDLGFFGISALKFAIENNFATTFRSEPGYSSDSLIMFAIFAVFGFMLLKPTMVEFKEGFREGWEEGKREMGYDR